MSDSAIYRRTVRGQRALLRSDGSLSPTAMQLLARVNGYTDLRRLVDLAPGSPRDLPSAIRQLYDRGLIELLDEPTLAPPRRSFAR